MPKDNVRLIMDQRSLRSFTRHVDALINVVPKDMLNAAIETAEEILADSNGRIPVDTGTAARSAGYKIESTSQLIHVRVGYAIVNDTVNPRTGESASSYITTLHEDLTTPHSNGEAKFFETAVINHSETFYDKGRTRLAARLPGKTVHIGLSDPVQHTDYMSPALNRVSSGFTERVAKGQYLPYPVDSSMLQAV